MVMMIMSLNMNKRWGFLFLVSGWCNHGMRGNEV